MPFLGQRSDDMPAVYETTGKTPKLMQQWALQVVVMDGRFADYMWRGHQRHFRLEDPNVCYNYLTQRNHLATLAGIPKKTLEQFRQENPPLASLAERDSQRNRREMDAGFPEMAILQAHLAFMNSCAVPRYNYRKQLQ